MKKKVFHVPEGSNPAVIRHQAEQQTGEKQPSDGYANYYRDVRDCEAYFESLKPLFETDELTPEEQELFMDFSKAVSNIIGHGHMIFSGRVVPIEIKKLLMVPLISLGNVMVLADDYAFKAKQYWRASPMDDPERRMVVVTRSLFEIENLVRSCAQAGWDYFKSKTHFDAQLESAKHQGRKTRIVWEDDDERKE